jgi:hypothetical protein
MAHTLLFDESEQSLLSGFPLSVEIISSNAAAIIYYTEDGSTPTPLSTVYASAVILPLTGVDYTLRAVAYAEEDGYWIPSNILGYTWSLDNSAFFMSRKEGLGGVAYIYPGSNEFSMWFDFEGSTAVFIDQDPEGLPLLISERDRSGNLIPENGLFNAVAGPENTPSLRDDEGLPYMSALGLDYFNPDAAVIVMDTRVGSVNPPAVPVANGSFMSRRDSIRFNHGRDLSAGALDNFNSGQHIKSFINPATNTHVAYYYDSVDAKWIRSISTVEFTTPTAPVTGYSFPLVVQWNLFGRFNTF